MKRLILSAILTLALAFVARPARADSDPYFQAIGPTVTATGVAQTLKQTTHPLKKFAIQVNGVGSAATTWSVNVEVSLDGSHWTSILTHANADGDGAYKTLTTDAPATWVRLNVTSLSLGSATGLTVNLLANQ